MTWVEQMERDAISLAFPEWELQDSDIVDIKFEYDSGSGTPCNNSDDTFEESRFSINVVVRRGNKEYKFKEYYDKEADLFFKSLMRKGSNAQ